MHNYFCDHCGAALDPGEICDCKQQPEESERRIGFRRMSTTTSSSSATSSPSKTGSGGQSSTTTNSAPSRGER